MLRCRGFQAKGSCSKAERSFPAAPTFPGSYAVIGTIDDPNYTGSASGTLVITITALVRHVPSIHGGIDGSMQVLSGESFVLNGSAFVSGDLLLPGEPAVQVN